MNKWNGRVQHTLPFLCVYSLWLLFLPGVAYCWLYNTVTQLSRYQVLVALPDRLVQITPVTVVPQYAGIVPGQQVLP
jgi:hypothetical protein